ncbi:hypothetical protein [Stanieria cyanosphaera]|uniref:hypothetical protein n=1 Tax=Stanieria cyanosphaera TaxID=102116 RepID=UPI0012372ABF|nr:hypothetical protein [Stanieria cyanosphaera]
MLSFVWSNYSKSEPTVTAVSCLIILIFYIYSWAICSNVSRLFDVVQAIAFLKSEPLATRLAPRRDRTLAVKPETTK